MRHKIKLLSDRMKSKNVIVTVIFILLIAALLGYGIWSRLPERSADYSKNTLANNRLESHILVGGDVYWGRGVNDWSMHSTLKYAYPFSKLNEFRRDTYDAWVANLECPSLPNVDQAASDRSLTNFNCNSNYLPEAAKWFTAFSLANNHIANQGKDVGQQVTRDQLTQHHIQYFGGYNPNELEDVCDVIQMPARFNKNGTIQNVSLPVAMCGYQGVYYKISDEALKQISRYSAVMPVIVMPHMGQEYHASSDKERQDLYRKMIDYGADMVIGNHPHWVQPAEAYKGKLIVYSMGNFIFDQQFSNEVSRSAAIDVQLSSDESVDIINRWTELATHCGSFQDDCLAQAEQLHMNKLSYRIKYGIVGVDTSSRITHLASQRKKEAILQRLNWSTVNRQLN